MARDYGCMKRTASLTKCCFAFSPQAEGVRINDIISTDEEILRKRTPLTIRTTEFEFACQAWKTMRQRSS